MEVAVVLEMRNTAEEEAAGFERPVSLSPNTNWSFRIPKYRFSTALGFRPVHVTVSPGLRLGAVPLVVQLPPPGGEYVGPEWMVSAEALEATPSKDNTPTVAASHIVQFRCALRIAFAATISAPLSVA